MFHREKKQKRFVAKRCGTHTMLGLQIWAVWDTKIDTWARQEGIRTVTTKRGAKGRAKWANREIPDS